MTELLRRGEEYIDQEEVMKATKTDRDIYDGGIRKRQQEEVLTNRLSNRRIADHRYRAMVRLVNSIRIKKIRWPEKLRSDPSIRDRSRICDFHKDHGHTTD
ncbi:Uncharacterized protein Adt_46172 [Abeliophyllum distichum]|uniref:Uncharacterized protein n=1 Tax=Abeliophyllum distichum TaxID=126358 RepID=A0ABD1P1X5_9LAMI